MFWRLFFAVYSHKKEKKVAAGKKKCLNLRAQSFLFCVSKDLCCCFFKRSDIWLANIWERPGRCRQRLRWRRAKGRWTGRCRACPLGPCAIRRSNCWRDRLPTGSRGSKRCGQSDRNWRIWCPGSCRAGRPASSSWTRKWIQFQRLRTHRNSQF